MSAQDALGYLWIVQNYSLKVCPLLTQSFSTGHSIKRIVKTGETEETHYPVRRYRIRISWQEQLAFALKHEGVNVEVLRAFFRVVNPGELAAFIAAHPLGAVQKRVWFCMNS